MTSEANDQQQDANKRWDRVRRALRKVIDFVDWQRMTRRAWRLLSANMFRLPRWLLAAAILAVCLAGLAKGWFEVCSETSSPTGIKSTCEQPTVTDAGVLLVAALVALLILPDLAEVGVLGLSLKRRVADVEERLAVQDVRLEGIAASASSSAAQAIVYVGPEQVRRARDDLDDKVSAFRHGESSPDSIHFQTQYNFLRSADAALQSNAARRLGGRAHYPSVGASDNIIASLGNRLIRNWEWLSRSLLLGRSPRDRNVDASADPKPVSKTERDRFVSLFDEQIQVVRAARNAVAHAEPISEEELRDALEISISLVEILTDDR